jgi:cytochrome d ubiquinol oxidase subunit I
MDLDAVMLSRIQFAITIGFHILFPTLTIGLASFLLIVEVQWLRTGDEAWRRLFRFWVKLFALAFGMGVVSGIVLSYEIGTNFGPFARATANAIGPLFGYEVLTAFFLEAGFLGIMLFGWDRVGPRLHLFATAMVAAGTVISAFWILAANSWMQTPQGHTLVDGIFYAVDFWKIIFNPSFPYRLAHMTLAAYLATAFAVAAVSAWHVRRGDRAPVMRRGLVYGLGLAAVLAPAQVVIGDLHGLQVREHQPIKLAAIEAIWRTSRGAPLLLFAWPDEAAETNRYEIGIPKAGSLILTHDPAGEVKGLTDVPPEDRPNVPMVFFAFRLMVGLGVVMLVLAWAGAWLYWRGRLAESQRFLALLIAAGPSGFVAVLAGWIVAEVGRQPWIVYGLMRTTDAVSAVPAAAVATSLTLFVVVYLALLGAFFYVSARLIRRGAEVPEGSPGPRHRLAGRP